MCRKLTLLCALIVTFAAHEAYGWGEKCPPNFKNVADRCYYFTTRRYRFAQAKALCNTMGGHLPILNNQIDRSNLYATTIGHRVWLGAQRVGGTWTWLNGKPVTYADWYGPYPLAARPYNCLTFGIARTNQYANFICNGRMQVACVAKGVKVVKPKVVVPKPAPKKVVKKKTEAPKATSAPTLKPRKQHKVLKCPHLFELVGKRCLHAVDMNLDWDGASSKCAAAGGYLVSVHNAGEDKLLAAFIKANIKVGFGAWVGGYVPVSSADGKFSWTDGTPLNYVNWAKNNPNPNPDLGCMAIDIAGKMYNHECSNAKAAKFGGVCATKAIPVLE